MFLFKEFAESWSASNGKWNPNGGMKKWLELIWFQRSAEHILRAIIENDEYSYPKAYTAASLTFAPIQNSAGRKFEKLDIRFVKDNVSVLIETKQNFSAADEEQLSAYVEYEKALTGNKIIAINNFFQKNEKNVWQTWFGEVI